MLISRRHLLLSSAAALGGGSLLPRPALSQAASLVGSQMVDFTLPSLSGNKQVSFSSFKGKVVLLNFWASWCGPCRKEMPAFDAMYKRLQAKGLEVVALTVDKDPADAAKFLSVVGTPSFTILMDSKAQVMGRFDIISMPTSFVVDKTGKIVQRIEGFSEEKLGELEKQLTTLCGA